MVAHAHLYPVPVTVWVLWVPPEKPKKGREPKPGYWTFNHIEDGHCEATKPTDRFGRGWHAANWRKRHAQLVDKGSHFGSPVLEHDASGLYEGEPGAPEAL